MHRPSGWQTSFAQAWADLGMKPLSLTVTVPASAAGYEIAVGGGLLDGVGPYARRLAGTGRRVMIVSDRRVAGLYSPRVTASLETAGFTVHRATLTGGERGKTLRSASRLLEQFSEAGISRTDLVVALGGGVVGDIAGFAAAIHLRGVPVLQVPTTLLAMIDASVGGKTGVNSHYGKNLIGAFHQPRGVLIDPAALTTLPGRELTAGLYEAVKHGALSGRQLLAQTAEVISRGLLNVAGDELASFIAAQAAFKASIVEGDTLESPAASGCRSRKILNLGHTLAHALEKVTGYRYLRHGEAVGHGLRFAIRLSKMLALLPEKDVQLLNDVVHRVGKLPPVHHVDPARVLEAFRYDKKDAGGRLQLVLLKGIGKPTLTTAGDLPQKTLAAALMQTLQETR